MLAKSPGFTAVGTLILALGIGANTTIFSFVDAVLLRSLPYKNPERLVSLKADLKGRNIPDIGMSVQEMWDFRDRAGVFDEVSAVWPINCNLTGSDQPERVEAMAVSWNYFRLLGAQAALGRVFDHQDDAAGFAEGAVISDSMWRRMFAGDPWVLGKKLKLDSDLYTIVGVLSPGFRHPGRTLQGEVEVWITTGFTAAPFQNPPVRRARFIPGMIAAMKPGVSVGQAQARLVAFASQLSSQYPNDYPAVAQWTPRVTEMREDLVGKQRPTLLVVLGAVGFVLLICSVSLANLLLARLSARQRESAVRIALGASRGHLIRLLMSETVLLSLIGGTAGLLMVIWLRPLLISLAPVGLPRLSEVGLNWTVLAFCAGISLATGVVLGIAPALQLSSSGVSEHLKEGARGSSGSGKQRRFRSALVIAEVALSLMLMAGAGLLLRSFWNLLDVNPGFNTKNVLVANIWMPIPNNPQSGPYFQPAARAAFIREALRRAQALPGVESAAVGGANTIPFLGWNTTPVFLEGKAVTDAVASQTANVSSGFFKTLGIRLVDGRFFSDAEDQTSSTVLIDETAAHRFWPNEPAMQKRIRFGNGPQTPWRTVVGVVGDIKTGGLDTERVPHVYFPVQQSAAYSMAVFLRVSSNPGALAEPLRREIQAIDHDLPVFGIRTMEQIMATSLAQRRFALEMVGAFALVALLLSAIGIYGVTAFSVSLRTREIGVRMALGAERRDVLSLILGDGMRTMLWGLGFGLAGALVLTRFLRTLLFGASPADPLTYVAVSVLLAVVALVACYVPARRAMRVDPLEALRCE
jgi:predicted permease